ncbi:MAG: PilZ domain-containing protein [Deltaproteobacteria bacterium]|nr:PilZ domain-containing protein [Deltaproteobacteria bacterium]
MESFDVGWVMMAGTSAFLCDRLASLLSDSGIPLQLEDRIVTNNGSPKPCLVIADASALAAAHPSDIESFNAPILGVADNNKDAAGTFPVKPHLWLDPGHCDEDILFQLSGILFERNRKRRHPRALVRFAVDYTISGLCRTSLCTNLSLGGLFILSLIPPEPETNVQVELYTDIKNASLSFNCTVLYSLVPDASSSWIGPRGNGPKVAKPGFAAIFNDLGPKASFEIKKIIESRIEMFRAGGLEYKIAKIPAVNKAPDTITRDNALDDQMNIGE